MALPYVPGTSFADVTKTDFRKSQSLDYKNGYALKKLGVRGIGGELIPNTVALTDSQIESLQQQAPILTFGPPRNAGGASGARTQEFVPAHVAFDKLVLRFDAYFKQTVHESPDEQYRVRKVKIHYYVEDDSISVVEPPVENSGIPQGVLIKRQRLPKDSFGNFFVFTDLNVGELVEFYGKVFKLVDCDKFTREYLTKKGVEVRDPEHFPDDPYTVLRNKKTRNPVHAEHDDKLRKFLDNDRKVLRFYCVWDDRESMFGEMRPFVLHYFLVDDTVEVREVQTPNGGRDPFPVLLKRQQLPKDFSELQSMAGTGKRSVECYTPRDLNVGRTINLFGRRFLLYDADKYTRDFYQTNYAADLADPITVSSGRETPKERPLPPYNGFGSEQDSLGSCISLVPKPPRKDFIKMLENEHKILRFAALMKSAKAEDQGRQFIVSYRLADDMMTIYEPPQRNAGIMGGKFLERTHVRKPGSDMSNPQYYKPSDLYIGACIEIFCHKFVLTDADEYALRFMEDNCSLFPMADVQRVAARLRQALLPKAEAFRAAVQAACFAEGQLRPEALRSLLLSEEFGVASEGPAEGSCSHHEVLTLLRASTVENSVSVDTVLQLVA